MGAVLSSVSRQPTVPALGSTVVTLQPLSTIRVAELQPGIGSITLARPAKRNAIDTVMVSELQAAIGWLVEDGASVIVLRAEGPIWCAGIDLACARAGLGNETFAPFLELLMTSPVFFVAAVEWPALGLGVATVAVCPLTICRSDAWFALPERDLNLFPSGVTSHLEAVMGARRTMSVALSGERISAERAMADGLVNDVASPEAFDGTLERWLDLLQDKPGVTDFARRAWQSRFQSAAYMTRRRDMDSLVEEQEPSF